MVFSRLSASDLKVFEEAADCLADVLGLCKAIDLLATWNLHLHALLLRSSTRHGGYLCRSRQAWQVVIVEYIANLTSGIRNTRGGLRRWSKAGLTTKVLVKSQLLSVETSKLLAERCRNQLRPSGQRGIVERLVGTLLVVLLALLDSLRQLSVRLGQRMLFGGLFNKTADSVDVVIDKHQDLTLGQLSGQVVGSKDADVVHDAHPQRLLASDQSKTA